MSHGAQSPCVARCPRCQVLTLSLGGKVDFIRRNLGLTIAQYAAKCGVPEKTMERVLLDSNKPSALTLYLIVTRGGVALDVITAEDLGGDE